LNHALGKVIIWLIQEKNRALQQPFRYVMRRRSEEEIVVSFFISVRKIRLLKTIWQHLKTTLEKSTFNNEEVRIAYG
jgi:hypothetical protein